MDKFKSLLVTWLVIASHLTVAQAASETSTTAVYLDDNQLQNMIGVDDCGCLTNYEIKISNDATLYTGQLIRCTNVKQFNHINLINRLSALNKCSNVEKQFNEIIITKNKFQHFNYTLLQNLNFTIKVDLSHNGIEQIDELSFSGLSNLKYLDLSDNNLKQLNSNLFNGLTSLVKLNITGNRILNIEDQTFKHLNNLAYLDLSLNHIVAIRRTAFVGLNSLMQLNLSSNRIQSLEEGVFDSLISTARKIRLSNNQLICDCNLAWMIRAKERYNKNLIGKVMCSASHHEPRVKLSSVQFENLVCAKEVHLNLFEVNGNNSTKFSLKSGQRFVFDCRALDGKQLQSIRFYRNDHLIAESSNFIDYLSDQFMNTSGLLMSKDLIEFKRSLISVNNFTMNSMEQRLTIHRLNMNDAGQYQCVVSTAFGNVSRKFELKIQETNDSSFNQLLNQIKDLTQVPNFIHVFNSSLLLIAILIYLTNFRHIEMNSRLKHIQLHLWLQLLALINLFYYSSAGHFTTLNCQIYGLIIYYLLVSILFTILLASISLYKQLTTAVKCTSGKVSSLNGTKRNQTNFTNLTNHQTQPYGQAQFNQLPYNDELISEQILMYQRPVQTKNYCLQLIRFLFNHQAVRYHALNFSLTVFVVLVFGLFNLNQFKTDTRCFANILLVFDTFYIFVPLLILTIGQLAMIVVVQCAIKRFYILHKKLEQRDAVQSVTLKGMEHVLEHSNHVQNCMLCFREFKLDAYWSTSKHCLAQAINFVLYLTVLCLIILTVVSEDVGVRKQAITYWPPKLPSNSTLSTSSKLILKSIENLNTNSKNQTINETVGQLKLTNQTKKSTVQSRRVDSDLFDEQILTSIYLICTFLMCAHILVHYCLTRKDVLEGLKSFLVRTFCLYGCQCSKRTKCCTSHQNDKQLDRYANGASSAGATSGILNPNLDAQSSLLFDQHSHKSFYQQQYGMSGKLQPLLFEERTDVQLDPPDTSNGLYKLATSASDEPRNNGRNVRALNDQLLSSESNTSTTVTTGGSTMSNFITETLVNPKVNDGQQVVSRPGTSNRDHIYYETVNAYNQRADYNRSNNIENKQRLLNQKYYFDDTFLEGDGTSYSNNSAEKAKSDIVMNRARKMRKTSMNSKQKPRCIEVKYHQPPSNQYYIGGPSSPSGHLINSSSIVNANNQFNFSNQNFNRENMRAEPNKPTITSRLEREFVANQLKKYGSDNLEKWPDYLPPVAKQINCKSEVMTTVSQPATFFNNNNNSRANCLPSRRALLKSSSNQSNELNFQCPMNNLGNLSNSYNQNFSSPTQFKLKQEQQNLQQYNRKNKATTLSNRSQTRPLLVCGPTLNSEQASERYDQSYGQDAFNHANNRYQMKENLYERIPYKRPLPEEDHKLIDEKTIIEQENEDDCYDNLDECLVNLNMNRTFASPKNYSTNQSAQNDHQIALRNSPVFNLSDLRNSSRNSPNFTNSHLTNFTIKSNNSNRSIKSNQSKRSNHLSNNISSDFNNEMANDLIDKLIFSRSSTSSNDVFIADNQSSSFNSTESAKRIKQRNDQLNSILCARNENGQMMTNRFMDTLENSE